MATEGTAEGDKVVLREGEVGRQLSTPHGESFSDILAELGARVPARFVLLIDASGFSLASWGGEQDLDLASLSALAAGDLAASHEIARIAGEFEEHQIVMREGHSSYILVTDAGSQMVLLARVGIDVPMGWARMLIKEAALRLEEASLDQDGGPALNHPPIEADDLCQGLARALEGDIRRSDEC